MDQPFARVQVMARAPVAASTTTRLEPLLGPDGCARLQQVFGMAEAWSTTHDLDDPDEVVCTTPGPPAVVVRCRRTTTR